MHLGIKSSKSYGWHSQQKHAIHGHGCVPLQRSCDTRGYCGQLVNVQKESVSVHTPKLLNAEPLLHNADQPEQPCCIVHILLSPCPLGHMIQGFQNQHACRTCLLALLQCCAHSQCCHARMFMLGMPLLDRPVSEAVSVFRIGVVRCTIFLVQALPSQIREHLHTSR